MAYRWPLKTLLKGKGLKLATAWDTPLGVYPPDPPEPLPGPPEPPPESPDLRLEGPGGPDKVFLEVPAVVLEVLEVVLEC